METRELSRIRDRKLGNWFATHQALAAGRRMHRRAVRSAACLIDLTRSLPVILVIEHDAT